MNNNNKNAVYLMMYLDYLNNFLTVESFADYYSLTKEQANKIIEYGKEINNREV